MDLSISEEIVLGLLQSALWGKKPEGIYKNIPDSVWKEVYSLSISQGIQAIAFDGLARLPQTLYPAGQIMLTWAVNVKMIEQKYDYHCNAVSDLKGLFEKEGMDMLLLKGAGLSSYYPVSAHREYGDIDIYLSMRQEGVDKCLQHLHKMFPSQVRTNATFYFKNIPVENHLTFLHTNKTDTFLDKARKKSEESVEKKLLAILKAEGSDCIFLADKKQVQIPSATFNFLFLTYHAGLHLPRGIVLRHLCDWACFLSANKGKYDEKQIEEVLRNSRFDKIASLMTWMAVTYLGLPDEYVPSIYRKSRDKRLEHRILLNILHPFPSAKPSYNRYSMTIWKTKRFLLEHWKYKLVHGDNILKRVGRSLLWWYEKQHISSE